MSNGGLAIGAALGGAVTLAMAAASGRNRRPFTGLLITVGVTSVTLGFLALAASRARNEHERRSANGAANGTAKQTALGVTANLALGLL